MPDPWRPWIEDPGWDTFGNLRKGLLQRIAVDLGQACVRLRDIERDPCLPCCWVHVDRAPHSRREGWLARLCSPDCPHVHHEHEVWIATP